MAIGRGRKRGKLLVKERTLLMRVNRHLAPRGEHLQKLRGQPRYVHVSATRAQVLSADINLEKFARSLGVLASYEAVAPQGGAHGEA